ncbi:helix-turn-helix domain-containing protein [Pyxidicoccus caerfyrddinensis]|uniref:helix-turn-helix domain-containing protein n=1 Tax=Pyxidicoccus caerfyrddinensis TaxID=2709663 RepID=UPI0013DC41F3
MNPPLNTDLLRVELVKLHLTQRALAAKIGVSPTTLSGWLRGAHRPPPDLIVRIEQVLGLAAGALLPDVQGPRADSCMPEQRQGPEVR